MALAPFTDPPPALPATTEPMGSQAWRDYETAFRAWNVKLQASTVEAVKVAAALQTGAGAAATAWQTASTGS